jgi:chromosome partitioning protein
VRKSIRFAESAMAGATVVGAGTNIPGTAAYRAIARELLGLPEDPELLATAGWTPEQRDDILGLTDVAEGAG